MTELLLYKFIKNNNIEHRWTPDDDVIVFINEYSFGEFLEMLDHNTNYLTDYGVRCVMKSKYLAIYMKDYCEYHDIKMENVFEKQ